MKMDWNTSTYFSMHEFKCSHTGQCDMNPEFIDKLNELRLAFGKPMTITSGYRHVSHPIERKKETPGAHTTGQAADIAVSREDAFHLLSLALSKGFTGIGIQQKGSGRFIHLDTLENSPERPRPTIWSY
jgi:zinc D-Ala-D-Ala carboxypeptidase